MDAHDFRRLNPGTDREFWEATRGAYRLEVWFDEQAPDDPGWAYRLWEETTDGGELCDQGPLDETDPDNSLNARTLALTEVLWGEEPRS